MTSATHLLSLVHLSITGMLSLKNMAMRPPSPLVGCTCIITCAILTAIHTLYEQEPNLYKLCTFLVQHNLIVSKATLTRSLTAAGLTCKILHKIAIECDKELRNDWKDLLCDQTKFAGDGSEFVAVDETSKNKRSYARLRGWSLSLDNLQYSWMSLYGGDRYSLVGVLGEYHKTRASINCTEFLNNFKRPIALHLQFPTVSGLTPK